MEHLIIFNLSDYCYFLFLVADKKFPVSLSVTVCFQSLGKNLEMELLGPL